MFQLPELPYDTDALEPVISKTTLEIHHGKHHAGYVDKLNKLVSDNSYQHANLIEIIKTAPKNEPLYNNAGQVYSHSLYWDSLLPNSKMEGPVVPIIESNYGSIEDFKNQFVELGMSRFGSGWLWIVYESSLNEINMLTTSNAQVPLEDHHLLVCDLWEHAYYLDYQNKRKEYLEQLFTILNWEMANSVIKDVELF